MFVIFGLRTKARRLGMVAVGCRVCGHGAAVLIKESTKFSLFFVPLIPVGSKYVAQCANPMCGARTRVDSGTASRLLPAAR